MLRSLRRVQTPISLVLRNIQTFSKTENIESLAIEPSSDLYLSFQKEEFSNLYSTGYHQRIGGHATTKGTKYYSLRSQIVDPSHFRTSYHDNLTISSIGIGTYVGEPTETDDLKMFNGITESVETGGVNIIDTAINYRYQKSERVVGAALRHLLKQGYSRDEFFICSKNGYIPEDAEKGISNESIISNLIEKGKLTQADVIKERFGNTPIHCIHPAFLEDQLERTLTNIGVETLDLYYLHNPAESQLPQVGRNEFYDRLAKAFEFCEKKAEEGKIRSYGLATWACFRAKHTESDLCLRLQEVVETAKKVAGDKHRFRYIQLPFNLLMPEAFLEKWQEVKEGDKITRETLFQVAKAQKVNVITSSPLAQGLMSQVPLSSDIFKANNLGAKHLQFSRSVPAQALLSTLVGQKTARHTKKNLEVIQYPPLNDEEWLEFFKPSIRRPKPEEAVEMDE